MSKDLQEKQRKRREQGLCPGCGERPPAPNRRRCQACTEYGRQYYKTKSPTLRARRLANGLCANCGARPPREDRKTCSPCYDAVTRWREKNRDQHLANKRNWRGSYDPVLRQDVLLAYGSSCACCGETRDPFLTIDHINGDSPEGPKKFRGSVLYAWLRKNGFPAGYRILCCNCNFATRYRDPC